MRLPLSLTFTLPIVLLVASPSYILRDTYIGEDFLDSWKWETFNDPTHGRVNYVDQETALRKNLSFASIDKFVMRVDSQSYVSPDSRGRDSVRIISDKAYNDVIMIINLTHMPHGCAVWPAFWTISRQGPWPYGAEIDIIETVNMDTRNLASLHTSPYCTMSPNRAQQGLAVSSDCDASHNYNQGCGTRFSRDDSAGPGFNAAGGGRFAMMKSRDEGIKVWFWSNSDPNIPTDVKSNLAYLDPNSWGPPEAYFPTSQDCDYDGHFNSHQAIFDITLCGDWAGDSKAYTGANCPGSCSDYVDNHPEAFADAYWEIDSLLVYVPFFGPLQ